MSDQDDEYDLDDDVLDGSFEEDLEDQFDDFDELEDEEESFDEDEVLFDGDEEDGAFEGDVLGAEKKSFKLDIGFDKIVIMGAIIVGVVVLVFQVTTKKAEQKVEVFQSAVTMKGATDGEVFGESQSKDITTSAPENKEKKNAFLYEAETLDTLPNNLEEGKIVKNADALPLKNPYSDIKRGFTPQNKQRVKEDQIGEFVSITSGDVLKKQKDFSTEEKKKEKALPIVEEDVELEELNLTSIADTNNDRQEDLNFVPIENVIQKTGRETTIDKSSEPLSSSESLIAQQQKEKAQMELSLLQDEIETLKNQRQKISEEARIEKEALMQARETKERLQASIEKEKNKQAALIREQKNKPKKPVSKQPKPPQVKDKKPVNVVWQLRSAKPGQAWISEKGKQDIISVSVGSVVKGIGKVTSISMKNGRWVVAGPSGNITQ